MENGAGAQSDKNLTFRRFLTETVSFATGHVESLLVCTKEKCGCNWAQAIVVATVAIRLLSSVPGRFFVLRNNQRIRLAIETAVKDKLPRDVSRSALELEYKKFNCHPYRAIIPMVYCAPLFLVTSNALRKAAGAPTIFSQPATPLEPLMSGGMFWFQNLCEPDLPLSILVCTGSFLLIRKSFLPSQPENFMRNAICITMHGLNFLSFFAFAQLPSCVTLYALASVAMNAFERWVCPRLVNRNRKPQGSLDVVA